MWPSNRQREGKPKKDEQGSAESRATEPGNLSHSQVVGLLPAEPTTRVKPGDHSHSPSALGQSLGEFAAVAGASAGL